VRAGRYRRVKTKGRERAPLEADATRVITSDGAQVVRKNGAYKRADLPAGALVVSRRLRGVVEYGHGVLSAWPTPTCKAGEILVTPSRIRVDAVVRRVKGMVTEVGGMMTHARVIRRGNKIAGRRRRGATRPGYQGWAANPRQWHGRDNVESLPPKSSGLRTPLVVDCTKRKQ